MELRQLRTFVRVAALGSFSRAAEELMLTQPAVTRQIAALERECRTRLLERMGRRVEMTPAGEMLYRYAAQMLRLEDEAARAVSDVVAGMAGRLAIGASSTAAAYVLPPLLSRYREAYPRVELSVHTGISSRIEAMVEAGGVDLGVVTGSRLPEGLHQVPVCDYVTVAVVYPEHPLASAEKNGTGPRVPDLAGAPLLLMQQGTHLREYVDQVLAAAGVEAQVSMELDSVEAIKKMIEARLGISLLPLVSVRAEVETGRLAALSLADLEGRHRRVTAVYRQDKYVTAAMKAFLAMLKE